MYDTTAFIKALRERVNEVLPTYYSEAPSEDVTFPYAVISGINIIDLAAGDLVSFYIDIWTDEKLPGSGAELERLCDKLRNELTDEVIAVKGVFAGHIGFDNRNTIDENEFDISHRRLSMSARVFYN